MKYRGAGPTDVDRRPDGVTLSAFAGFVLLAGANGTAVNFTIRELAPQWSAAVRFLAAAVLFLGFAFATKREFPRGRALVGAVLYGVVAFAFTYGLIYWAFGSVKPGVAQVVIALVPLLTLVMAVAQRQERFRWTTLAGAVMCLVGIAFTFRDQLAGQAPLWALLALVGATLCIAQSTVMAKRFPKADVIATNGVATAVAGLLLLALSFALGEEHALPRLAATWWALAFLVLVGSVAAFVLFLVVVHRWTASAASFQWVLLPLVAVPVSSWLTGEPITPALLGAGVLILGGVYLGAFWRPRMALPNAS